METEHAPSFLEVLLSQLRRRFMRLPKGTNYECRLRTQVILYDPQLCVDVGVEVDFYRLRWPLLGTMPGPWLRSRIYQIFNEVIACIPPGTPNQTSRDINLIQTACCPKEGDPYYRVELIFSLYGTECIPVIDKYTSSAAHIRQTGLFSSVS